MSHIGLLSQSPSFKNRLTFLVNQQPDLTVDAHLTTPYETTLSDLDLLLMIPDQLTDYDWVADIHRDCPALKVVVLGQHLEKYQVEQVLDAGANAYLLQDAPNHEIIFAIKQALDDQRYVDARLNPCPTRLNLISHSYTCLSKREVEVFPYMVLGYSNKEIAADLFISPKTVEAHKSNVMRKLHMHSRPELVHYALLNNLITA